MSILSFPDRGKWGNPRWRGNASGHVYKALFEQFNPKVFVDPMVGSGTSVEVAKEMGIEAHGLDLHSGFNALRQSILEAVGKPADLCVSHPPYLGIVRYSGTVWGSEPHPDDLSHAASIEDFMDKLQVVLLNQRHATKGGGIYGCLIGDVRSQGKYYSLQAELIARLPRNELRSILIKTQHNCVSDAKQYASMRFPRILHEYLLLFETPRIESSWLGTLAQVAHEAQRRLNGTWKSVVWGALAQLGGQANLDDLYAVVADKAPERLAANTHWREKIRQTLQLHADTFGSEERGIWKLAA